MALKWNKKMCIEYGTQLRDPLAETEGGGQGLSPIISKVRELTSKFKGGTQ